VPCGDSKRDELLGGRFAQPVLKLPPAWAACPMVACVLFAGVLGSRQLKSITMFDARHKELGKAVLI
jgi:hypothetical protein